jgi:hypothetical protein
MTDEPLPDTPPPAPRRRRRWLRWLPLLPLLLIAAVVGYYFYAARAADGELAEVLAETDRLDADWRLEQIEATRKTYPPEENAAETVLAAHRLLPRGWPTSAPPPAAPQRPDPPEGDGTPADDAVSPVAGQLASLQDRTVGLPPEARLDDALVRDLRAELATDAIKQALDVTERLSRQTGGRYTVNWGPNPVGAVLPCQDVRPVSALLRMQALLQAEDGAADSALVTARRIVIAGRSIGDEPGVISQLVRIANHAIAAQVIERVLAQGQPSAEALAQTQSLLVEDAAEPLMLYAFRGERALLHRLIEGLKSGDVTLDGPAVGWRDRVANLSLAHAARRTHPEVLRTLNEAVAIARREPEEWALPLTELADRLDQKARDRTATGNALIGLVISSYDRLAAAFRRDRAILRNMIVALALERYRRDNGRWPQELKALVPAYLPTVPRDAFDGKDVRYRTLPDGVLVYSVGPDGEDNGGALNRKNVLAAGTDLGFRLWDADQRRQPPAEVLPPPDEEVD